MKTNKLLIYSLLSILFFTVNCGNATLAEYKDGKITEKEINQLADIYNLSSRINNPQLKRQLVHDYAVTKILSQKALDENLDKSDEAVYLKKLFQGNTIKNLMFKQKQDEQIKEKEIIFHARHILFKEPLKSPGVSAGPDTSYEDALKVRQELLDKKISFEEAVEKYSGDPGSKSKGGDLGYFPSGVMVPEFQAALDRMAGVSKDNYMVIDTDKIKFLSKPEGGNISPSLVVKGSTVKVLDKDKPAGWTKIEVETASVYVPTGSLKPVGDESKYSIPIKTIHGWHIIQLIDSDKMSLDDFADKLEDTDFKGQDNSKQLAMSRARMYWSRIKGSKVTDWQKELYSEYGVADAETRTLQPGWEKKEYLINNDKIKITAKEFLDFINWLANDQGIQAATILSNKDNIQRYYQVYTDLQIFNLEGEKQKLMDSKEYQERKEIEKQQFLAEIYKRKKWYNSVTYTEKELLDMYENMKKNRPVHMKSIKPFNQMKDDLIRQVRGQKINMLIHKNTEDLLASVGFKYNEKEFKQESNGSNRNNQ